MKSLLLVVIGCALLASCSAPHKTYQAPRAVKVTAATKKVVGARAAKVSQDKVSVHLKWDANPEPDIAGYRVHYGTTAGVYSVDVDAGNVTETEINDLEPETRYYFVVSAYDTDTFESPMSNEVEWINGGPAPTATPTLTPTPTPTPTPSPTVSPTATPGNLVNISTRGFVHTGSKVLIGGFIIVEHPRKVIIRAIGPSLSAYFPEALANPFLELRSGTGGLLDENDDWRDDQEEEIIATGIPPSDNLESAIVRTLDPGSYTAIVRGVGGETGIALVEVYAIEN